MYRSLSYNKIGNKYLLLLPQNECKCSGYLNLSVSCENYRNSPNCLLLGCLHSCAKLLVFPLNGECIKRVQVCVHVARVPNSRMDLTHHLARFSRFRRSSVNAGGIASTDVRTTSLAGEETKNSSIKIKERKLV